METPIELKAQKKKETLVDTLGLVSFSLIAGAFTDYASGLRGIGILASRAYGTAINIPTAGPYGKWRNFLYKKTKTTDKSSNSRKYLVELLAFDTFQVPLYATVVSVGSLASNMMQGEIKIDFDKVEQGTAILTAISPLVSPTVGLYMEGMRKAFGLSSAPKKARESLEYKVE
jgi:hypothetical protein